MQALWSGLSLACYIKSDNTNDFILKYKAAMGISHLTKKLALPLLFVATLVASILIPAIPASASGTGENYYLSSSATILGFGGSYNDTNYLYTPVTAGTTQAKQAVGNLTFTRDGSGKFVSSTVYAARTSGTQQISCTMTLSISLSGSSGTISANPTGTTDAKTCLDLTGLATSITVSTFTDQASCVSAGGTWSQGAGSQQVCTGVTAAGAQCAASGQTYVNQGTGHIGNGAQWVCAGTTTQVQISDQYKDQSSCETAGYVWNKATSTCGEAPLTATCEADWKNPLSLFILCPIFNGLSGFSDWLLTNAIAPILKVAPVVTSPDNTTYMVWSSFRIYANIILVIVLLLIVFGQVIGGGVMDAYSVRKALPRILAAAILINLSIYIVALLVDVTNVIGGGLMSLMEAPLGNAGLFHFELSAGQTAGATAVTILGAGGTVGGAILAYVGGTALVSAVAGWVGLFVLLPAIMGLLAAFITVMLRLTIITALIFVAPVAFALWCLPNTEKYFKKWWSTLLNMLLAYPIIVAIFAICDIMSVTMFNPGTNQQNENPISALIGFVLQFLPLFLIPFAFKISGGAMAAMSGFLSSQGKRATEAIKGNPNDPFSLQNQARGRMRDQTTQARGNVHARTSTNRRSGVRFLGRTIGGGARIQERLSDMNAAKAQRNEATVKSGDDTFIKASTIPLSALDDKTPVAEGGRWRRATWGEKDEHDEQWSTPDGSWYTKSQIKTGNKMYPTIADHQYNSSYVLGKAEPLGPKEQEMVATDFFRWGDEARLPRGMVAGGWQGVSIPKQGFRQDLRFIDVDKDPQTGQYKVSYKAAPLLRTIANTMPHQLAPQQEGTWNSVEGALHTVHDRVVKTPDVASISDLGKQEQEKLERGEALNAFFNLEKYVSGSSVPDVTLPYEPGAEGDSRMASQAAAAARNSAAAKATYGRLMGDASFRSWVDANRPEGSTGAGSSGQSGQSRRPASRPQGTPTPSPASALPSTSQTPTPSSPSPRRATRPQGPAAPPETTPTETVVPLGPRTNRSASRPQGYPGQSFEPDGTPPTTITYTPPTPPIDLPPPPGTLFTPPTPPGSGPADIPNPPRDNDDN